ncbi:MAG TPA: beta-N-acetylhexosaminidase [Terriglobia bacterium]|nr:beta-N-acetylhexosaminidase [Terriglobia bacterium]
MIFPLAREVTKQNGRLKVDPAVVILVPELASSSDLFHASLLSAELADQHGIPLRIRHSASIPKAQRFILIGDEANPLVQQYRRTRGVQAPDDRQHAEGYMLDATSQGVAVLGRDPAGAFYGLQTLRQILEKSGDGLYVPAQRIVDWPDKPFRGVYIFVPGRRHLAYFKRFVREVMAPLKLNKVIVEMDAGMQFDRHPELNAGWIDFTKDMKYTRRGRSTGPHEQFQDSGNMVFTDGGVLEKEEVAEMVRYARQHYVDVIPEISTLTHSYYLLTRHRELAEITSAEWPDTYCPSNPATYRLAYDVMDEYIEVMKPRMVHIGHDEWRMPWGICPRCKGKDPTVLFAQDVNKIYSHLKRQNVEVAMWGDHLIERVRGRVFQQAHSPVGYRYQTPGALSPQQVRELMPKDILIFNWFWNDSEGEGGEKNDIELSELGFHQVYGNMTPEIQNYERRSQREGVVGGAPSSWADTTEFNFGKDMMYDIVGCANLTWSRSAPAPHDLSEKAQRAMPDFRRRVSMQLWPSDDDPVTPVDISAHLNAPAGNSALKGVDLAPLRSGAVRAGNLVFNLVNAGENAGRNAIAAHTGEQRTKSGTVSIPLGEDASSVIFLHACSLPGRNELAFEETWNNADTADLLGFYRFVYEDGLVETAPVRYGVNILEAGWGKKHEPRNVAWEADLVDCGRSPEERVTLFAFEWVNPRFGMQIKEVRLEGISGFKNSEGKTIPDNALILLAVSVVKKRPFAKSRASTNPWAGPGDASPWRTRFV